MSKSIKQLRNDLTILSEKIKDLAINLQGLYRDYLESLSVVVKRQLTLATYQICTQKYPDAFLNLSYQKRYDLQGRIKGLENTFKDNLFNAFQSIEVGNNQVIQDFYNHIISIFSVEQISKDNNLVDLEIAQNSENNLAKEEELNPHDLIKFQLDIEDCLEECLTNISHQTNKYLQDAHILPNKIPSKILEMALQAEENTSIVSGAPNLLSLLIEREDKSDNNVDITPIVAICLRLTEIEFNDPSLNLIRQKINNILRKLDDLDNEYQQKKQKYSIAQAESAWRSSWNE
ncbi:hypothetical protein [Geminocystis sp. NIES-3709]|uniref:hypothetical protein n=1 Tax=Geminocystis sp. NIES-3709 TaxID=1617448 RepID=UPI0005FCA457|nr:hypothetical protein [Geminocystis sp. NIES-3709]BAQ64722.1 hypothetical protein GM3709_1487 [Geminocystis sp. NIES-3709]